ncbi:D-alanyl-D-alanine carboxypeptidase/D-alanyl-D-alanine-endopeptidase [Bifidobacterium catenulatum subsp. kashiwanohense]|uniref:D-alanyl-D-alanine carboxypeptidase/D-alanyl-D-alanine-endopeptidase n=1 Tax=Bifidobacterium catenulatum TaxID=1686 RepID=UPI003D04A138
MDDSAEYRHVKRRRYITVALSVALTTVLCVGYVVADIFDKLPGVLTLQEVEHITAKTPGNAVPAATVVGGLDASKTVDAVAAKALISQFETAASDFGGEYAIAIADAAGNVVAEHDLDKSYTPASTMKTLTAYAAATTLDTGKTLDTQTYLEQREDGTARLVLKGNGDMLLGAGASDSAHINGRAGLGTLAANTAKALHQRDITSVTLVYDDSLFGNDRWPSGIAELDSDHVYYAPTASMAVDGGRNWNGVNPADPDIFSAYPALSTQPARETAQVFAQRLTEQGIAVNSSVEQGTVPEGTSPIAAVRSASLNEIMAFMLRHSDNSLAEEFGRLLALHLGADNSPAGAVRSVEQVLVQRGISTEGLIMPNCSGLSEGAKLTVRTLLEVQQRNLTSGAGAAAAEGLSVVGFVGTAANRLNDADEAGLIRVKTGSLGDVTSMTGNVSRHNGGALSFAVIVNNPDDFEAAKSAIDTFVAALPKL